VIFNHELSPAQQRNIERAVNARVLDRTELILEIFAQRAQTSEGKLQVELARLEHLSTRLVRGWTHLERQRGGLGKTGGPGETQLELDRRYIATRVKTLKGKLQQLQKQRTVQRRGRVRRDVLSVSIVGYTNAGKSTLFNALAGARAYEADQLFATLDTTTRKLFLPRAGAVVVSDTVCRTRWWPRSAPRSKRRCAPTCWCTSSMRAHPRAMRRQPKWTRCSPRSAPRKHLASPSGTRSTPPRSLRESSATSMVGFPAST